ncbi:tdh [Symbiodinium pilosum]|uniref:Tdh protein n=1 Tax=Symbiodinium pilosum TaxID=2952 RepID=A0A812IWW6_SYMPI|nr:tdh [Symbiodinium pilosum]
MKIDPERELRVGLHRAQHGSLQSIPAGGQLKQESASALLQGMIWTTFVDPADSEVNFHRSALFAKLLLQPASADIDCSCCAARLFSSKALQVVDSPMPLLEECPPGSLLIRAKFASLCGSDIPYFRDMASRAPSCYWDRDGFCGHEVVGEVLESSTERFAKGDSVLSLPSSYFKAHVATQQEWYKEEVHSVLLQNFPVRGGFSEIFTSHELCTYKIKECVPRMLAAQALGTLLRMFRRLGSFFGKTVAILGQGQNGLMATRLVAQLCARNIFAVEPLAFRRRLAEEFGATKAVAPEDAAAAVAAATGGRGADVVLEMVGHNQATINDALELVAKCGTVVAFGVPDDAVYGTFQFAKFFRKNVTLMSSVIPDPGVDFPQAVDLIERGSFSTEGDGLTAEKPRLGQVRVGSQELVGMGCRSEAVRFGAV